MIWESVGETASLGFLEQVILEHISRQMEKVTGKSQHGFTKNKLCLTNLNAVSMVKWFVDEGGAVDAKTVAGL